MEAFGKIQRNFHNRLLCTVYNQLMILGCTGYLQHRLYPEVCRSFPFGKIVFPFCLIGRRLLIRIADRDAAFQCIQKKGIPGIIAVMRSAHLTAVCIFCLNVAVPVRMRLLHSDVVCRQRSVSGSVCGNPVLRSVISIMPVILIQMLRKLFIPVSLFILRTVSGPAACIICRTVGASGFFKLIRHLHFALYRKASSGSYAAIPELIQNCHTVSALRSILILSKVIVELLQRFKINQIFFLVLIHIRRAAIVSMCIRCFRPVRAIRLCRI